jgi:hydrogenase maturation protease
MIMAAEDHGHRELNILVLGVGNVLLSDEGAGVRAVEALERDYLIPEGVEVLDGGTMGLELLPWLEERSHLLLVDAVQTAGEPGAVHCLRPDSPAACFRARISPHHLGLADVLAVAALGGRGPDQVIICGIKPARLETGLEFSPQVEKNLPRLVELVRDELAVIGAVLETKPTRLPETLNHA